MQKIKYLVTVFVFLYFTNGESQELPPFRNFEPSIYEGDGQNWDISQDSIGNIYVANNAGLLSFNGANWTLNNTPNRTVMRSIKVVNNYIYVGFYMQFGYYERDAFGDLQYTSISDSIKDKVLNDEDFWQIESYRHWILFRSLNRIYLYNTLNKEIQYYSSESTINCLSIINDKIYYHISNKGIFTLEEGKQKLFYNSPVIDNAKIINLLPSEDGILMITNKGGIYTISEQKVELKNNLNENYLKRSTVYAAINFMGDKIALGTISDGLILLDKEGNVEYHLNQEQGLINNTLLSLFEDKEGSIWLGTQHGLSYVNYSSSLRVYNDRKGNIGTIYDAIQFNEKLYLGTNQGLFYKPINSKDPFKLVPNTSGQVWELFEYDKTLFCGHDSGTFIIDNNAARLISNEKGTWLFRENQNNGNILFQGNYKGISVLEKKNNIWTYKNKVSGFNYSSQFFEIIDNKFFINHEFKGVYELIIDKDLNEFVSVKKLDTFQVNQASGLAKFKGKIYYVSNEGFYSYNIDEQRFNRNDSISKIIYDGFISGRMTINDEGIWMFNKNTLVNLKKSQLNESLEVNHVPFPSSPLSSSLKGFQKLSKLKKDNYLIGSTNGYIIINIDELKKEDFNITINSISNYKRNGDFNKKLDIIKDNIFNYKQNGLEISYSVPYYDAISPTLYQTKLRGRSDVWSSWTSSSKVKLENLPYGEYDFFVRAKVGDIISNNIATYAFSIKKPWYSSNLMLALYFLFVLLFSFFMHTMYRRYYNKKQEKLIEKNKKELMLNRAQSEKEIVKIKNEQLEKDIQAKSRELAASTMSIVKKNELLNNIKEHLIKLKSADVQSLKPVLKIIDRSLDHNDNWKLFKEAFNNVDRKFLKKLKNTHPNLSPNDIKLCAYLRLNLSSKEIAPLFNISARSVEIKRYRLRKKLNLSHEDNLVKYILSL